MVIVGSTALEFWDYHRQSPKDLDVWLEQDETYLGVKADCKTLPSEVMSLVHTYGTDFACPDSIYTIKCSHFAWDVKWEKTKQDILWLKAKGCEIVPALYTALKKHWEGVHGNKDFLSLSKDKKDFFEDHVTYRWDHDWLHELVSYPYPPMYTHCLKEGKTVEIDKEKFDRLTFEAKVRMFREEITVIAVERWLAHDKDIGWYKAYQNSLKKTITNLTKNWACDFIIHNLKHFVVPDYSYFKNVFDKLEILKEETSMTAQQKVNELHSKLAKYGVLDKDSLAVALASGDFDCLYYQLDYSGMENKRPNWSLRKENEEEWKRQSDAYWAEKNEIQEPVSKIFNSPNYEHIMQEGGGEGGAEHCYGVFKLDGKYYSACWSYYSYNGYEEAGAFNSLREVQPRTQTITVYE